MAITVKSKPATTQTSSTSQVKQPAPQQQQATPVEEKSQGWGVKTKAMGMWNTAASNLKSAQRMASDLMQIHQSNTPTGQLKGILGAPNPDMKATLQKLQSWVTTQYGPRAGGTPCTTFDLVDQKGATKARAALREQAAAATTPDAKQALATMDKLLAGVEQHGPKAQWGETTYRLDPSLLLMAGMLLPH